MVNKRIFDQKEFPCLQVYVDLIFKVIRHSLFIFFKSNILLHMISSQSMPATFWSLQYFYDYYVYVGVNRDRHFISPCCSVIVSVRFILSILTISHFCNKNYCTCQKYLKGQMLGNLSFFIIQSLFI